MTLGRLTLQLGGGSLFALVAALPFASQANACSATSALRGGQNVVDVACAPGDPAVAPFATSYDDASGGDGNDTLRMTGGSVLVGASGRTFVDGGPFALDPSTSFLPVQVIDMGGGDDIVVISGGQIGTAANPVGIALDNDASPLGADTFRMGGGLVTGSIYGLGGGNAYQVSGGTILGSIFAGSQNDNVTISGSAHIHGDFASGTDSIGLEDGNDRFTMTGGVLDGSVSGGNGNDLMSVGGGTINSFVVGNAGIDSVTVSGGTINGDIDAERVTLTGGTINGDISGISGTTLIINDPLSPAPLNIANGAQISGTDAVGLITDTDLAAGGTKSLGFNGFFSLTLDNSTLGISTGAVGISLLELENASTLFARGNVDMSSSSLEAIGSTVTLINGVAGDTLTLGGLGLSSSTVGVDVDQRRVVADRIVTEALADTGVNVVNVNLIGAPVFTTTTTIPILLATGATSTPSAAPPPAGSFVASGLPGTQGSLFSYQVLQTPAGLVLQIAPGAIGPAAAVQDATDVSIVDTVMDALEGIKNDALDFDLGLGTGSGATLVPLSDTFGIFASGQFAHTEHDGFEITANGFTGPGPSFGADEFSAAISLDFNVAKMADVEDRYGINLGLFGGYASADVDLDNFDGFLVPGHGENKSGMFGAYGLFRKELTYALIAATGFLGSSDITNDILGGAAGSYDTTGFAATASLGHIFMIGDKTRFDLRGGVLGVSFDGDDFVDSNGNPFGGTQISFGAVKFEPGIYTDRQLDNGMTFSPYLRGELQQRFGYENTASISGLPVHFDDADFSAALSTGFNLKMSKTATMSGEVRGKVSSDSSTIGAKLGLKIAF